MRHPVNILVLLMSGLIITPWSVSAQNVASPAPNLDFSKDPCGNPMMESQLFQLVEGTVTKILDGRTVAVTLQRPARVVTVQLVAVAIEESEPYSKEARERLRESLLNKKVEILVNPSKWEKSPRKVVGVVNLAEGQSVDASLMLLRSGLARFTTPQPYSMSHYTECQYKHAEKEARLKGLGLWHGSQKSEALK